MCHWLILLKNHWILSVCFFTGKHGSKVSFQPHLTVLLGMSKEVEMNQTNALSLLWGPKYMEETLCQKMLNTNPNPTQTNPNPNSDVFSVSLRVQAAAVTVRTMCQHSKIPQLDSNQDRQSTDQGDHQLSLVKIWVKRSPASPAFLDPRWSPVGSCILHVLQKPQQSPNLFSVSFKQIFDVSGFGLVRCSLTRNESDPSRLTCTTVRPGCLQKRKMCKSSK